MIYTNISYLKPMKSCFLITFCLLISLATSAQTGVPTDSLNFDDFGDVDNKEAKTFCTQKVLYLSPAKLISIGYEQQGNASLQSVLSHSSSTNSPIPVNTKRTLSRYGGLRLIVNTPVISRSNLIINLGVSYWNSNVDAEGLEQTPFWQAMQKGVRTTGMNATVFKPLDSRHFTLIQANADLNGNYKTLGDVRKNMLTISATAIYGWKRDDNFMWGVGLTRTYRGGNLLHIPVLYYTRTFSPTWGIEAILPARANIRRNFGTNSLLMLGYELEGNSYYLGESTVKGHEGAMYLRRSEIKPRLTFERQLTGFIWLSAQAGMAFNWRYNVFHTRNPHAGEKPVFTNSLRSVPYFNLSLNLVSP